MKRRVFALGGLYFAKEIFTFVNHMKGLFSAKERLQNILILVPIKKRRS